MKNRIKFTASLIMVLIFLALVRCGGDKSTGDDDQTTTYDNRIVYGTRYEGMFLINADGTGKRLLVDDDSCFATIWSPGKSMVVFTRLIPGSGYQIRAVDTVTSDVQYVAYGTYGYNPWSPDGNTLVYDHNNSVSTKTFGSVSSFPVLDNAMDAFFLNNDTLVLLYYPSGNTDSTFIFRIASNGTGLSALVNLAGYRCRLPRLSPARNKIAYVLIPDGNTVDSNQVCIMNTDGSGKVLLFQFGSYVSDMSFSYDGNEILIVADYNDTTRIQRLNIAARTVTAVNGAYSEDGSYVVKSSPDQPKFVYYLKDGGVGVINNYSTGVVDTLDTLGVQPDW